MEDMDTTEDMTTMENLDNMKDPVVLLSTSPGSNSV